MKDFKIFIPKVDKKRRLVLTRFYVGINNSNVFCYKISRINKRGFEDSKFKPLYAYGTDEFSSVTEFKHSGSGEKVKVYKTSFKSVFGSKNNQTPINIWNRLEAK